MTSKLLVTALLLPVFFLTIASCYSTSTYFSPAVIVEAPGNLPPIHYGEEPDGNVAEIELENEKILGEIPLETGEGSENSLREDSEDNSEVKLVTEKLEVTVEESKDPKKEPTKTFAAPSKTDQDLNSFVLEVIKNYNGNYPYLLNKDYGNYNGVTANIYYQDKLLLKAHPSGNRANHCVGITFEVFFKAMQERNKHAGLSFDNINGMTADELRDLILLWYVASGNKQNSNITLAVEKYGIGKRIHEFESAKGGDFIDISRTNGTGHTAVFIDWLKENGKIIGLRYWSSQGSTGGISYNEEYFNIQDGNSNNYGNLLIDQVYIARVLPITEYSAFR
jgi:hypothetical protein